MKHKSKKQFEKELMDHLKLKKYYKDSIPEEKRAIMRAYFEKYEYEKRRKLH
jgi:hypothetical protein